MKRCTTRDVLAIKQTIYRTGSAAQLMDLLIEAVRRGKEVLVVVELKARFDEEANINWAERLEAVGAQVGVWHRRTEDTCQAAAGDAARGGRAAPLRHLSTGNYNPRTARLYTDIGFLTADAGLTADADMVFQQLASLTKTRAPHHLLRRRSRCTGAWSPWWLGWRAAARAGGSARIVVETQRTDRLRASIGALLMQVRPARRSTSSCAVPACWRRACQGEATSIRVRSIVGRFLEHTRVLYFRWGLGEADEASYLSSADWMSRNMYGRIEVAWPLHDREAAPACSRRMPGALSARPTRRLDATGRRQLSAGGASGRQRPAGAAGPLRPALKRFAPDQGQRDAQRVEHAVGALLHQKMPGRHGVHGGIKRLGDPGAAIVGVIWSNVPSTMDRAANPRARP